MANKIGITTCNVNSEVGDLIATMVVVKPKNVRWFKTCDFMRNGKMNDFLVKKADFVHLEVIRAKDVRPDSEAQAVLNCLNSYHKFWKHDIKICSVMGSDELFESMFGLMTEKLRTAITGFIGKNWDVNGLEIGRAHV